MHYGLLDDDTLTERLKTSDQKAFEEIYRRHWFKLYCICYRQIASKQESEELVQTLFERIWKNRTDLVIKNIGAYLAVSLRNIIIDFQRKKIVERKFRMNHALPTSSNSTEEQFDHGELASAVENLLKQLPEKTQTVFKLSRYENKSVKEIAGKLQLTEKAVEYHITKSLKLFRHFLRHF